MIKLIMVLLLTANIAYAEFSDSENAIEQRLNELTDQIERLTHKNDLLQKKLDATIVDIEYRFKELQQDKKNEIEAAKPVNPKRAKAEFDKAYSLLKAQKYLEAEKALSWFVEAFPNNNEYTGNAYYWLGESFALRKKYNKAAINYINCFSKFPKSNKADLSMVKLVNALNFLGKQKEACSTLTKLKAKKASLSPAVKNLLQKEENKGNCNKAKALVKAKIIVKKKTR